MKIFEDLPLSIFEYKDTLNPAIFDLENEKMKIDVRKISLDIANDFYRNLKVKIDYTDIWLVGSNANFNWSDYSDVDIHIVLPFSKISDDIEFVKSYFDGKKNLWNINHEIKIAVHKIELYVQDSEDENAVQSGGIYSILFDSWIRHPEHLEVNVDAEAVKKQVKDFMGRFKSAFKDKNNPEKFKQNLDNLSKYLHDKRSEGLSTGGEFSPENIAFKFLRRKGVADKIKTFKNRAYDTYKSIGGSTAGYLGSKKQRVLSGNKNYVEKLDKAHANKEKKEKKKDHEYSDGIFYSIHGILFTSLRTASKSTGEKRSTIQYRVHSKNPKYTDYKVIYKK